MAQNDYDVAVLGAGIVGVCSALWLQRDGHRVALVDRDGPGSGSSYGNACTFANYACVPTNSPMLPRQLPKLLLTPDSPLSIDWTQIVRLTPWIIRFLANCTETRVAHIASALASLIDKADDGAFPLFRQSGADRLIRSRGFISLFETDAHFAKAQRELQIRRANGVRFEELSPDEVFQMEPSIAREYAAGVYFPDAHNYVNPREVCEIMVEDFVARGGAFLNANISQLVKTADGGLDLTSDGGAIHCDQVVVAAGAHSKSLLDGVAETVPLAVERGYHVCFPGYEDLINRPVGWAAGGFYLTPMNEGLRAAGTVELGGLGPKMRQQNLDFLARTARRLLPGLPSDPPSSWLGFRPSLPDALPIIGRSERSKNVIFAFGHQHVGMTLGGVTGRLVADIVAGRTPHVDIAPFAPGRF